MSLIGRYLRRLRNVVLSAIVRWTVPLAFVHRGSANAIFAFCRCFSGTPIFFRALALGWIDEADGAERGLLRQGRRITGRGPHFVGKSQASEEAQLPDVSYRLFRAASMSGASSSVLLGNGEILIERATGPDRDTYEYATDHVIAHSHDTAVVRFDAFERIERGIFLCGNGSANYYHWLIEILAKLEFIPMLPERYRAFPLVVSEDAVGIASFRETLGIFARRAQLIVLGKKTLCEVGELIYINTPSNVPFALRGDHKFRCGYAAIDDASIGYIRGTALAEVSAGGSYSARIFLCRKGARRNYNQDEVFDCLAVAGFVRVFMEDLSFREQVLTMQNADVVVGPSGAAWANLAFCKAGAKGLCWMAEEAGAFSAYSNLAAIVGMDLRYITYESGARSVHELYLANYYIEPALILEGLAALGCTYSTGEVPLNAKGWAGDA